MSEGFALYSSKLAMVEVPRAVRRQLESEPPWVVVDRIAGALSGVMTMPVSEQVIDVARHLSPTGIRSLDAVHLASAALLGADLVCAYDRKLLDAAAELGFRTISPA